MKITRKRNRINYEDYNNNNYEDYEIKEKNNNNNNNNNKIKDKRKLKNKSNNHNKEIEEINLNNNNQNKNENEENNNEENNEIEENIVINNNNNEDNNEDDNDNYDDDDDENDNSNNNNNDRRGLNIEKILGRKYIQNKQNNTQIDEVFLIKWKGLSYIHTSWEYREDLERVDIQAKSKIKRFLTSVSYLPPPPLPPPPPTTTLPTSSSSSSTTTSTTINIHGDSTKVNSLNESEEDDLEYFPSDLIEVQRIISCDNPNCSHSTCKTIEDLEEMTNNPEDGDQYIQYLVKWRGLPYCECSWERWEDIKQNTSEIFSFWKRQKAPKLPSKQIGHPSIQEYQRLVVSPQFGTFEENDDETTGLTLRDYQLEGVNWLLWNWWHKRPCILADEMGLGKTIQSVCFLHQLQHMQTTQVPGPFLVVAPLSLINQWQSEISLWSPNMNCVVLHGSAESRDIIQQYEFFYQEPFTSRSEVIQMKKNNRCKFDILLTTYEVAMKESKIFTKIRWRVLIVDEAHRLKNQSSKLFEQLQTIPRDQCVLLTGTPLQNKTEELWSLLHFADRSKFNNQADFISKFGDLRDASDVARLHAVLKPHLLRRVKEDVEKSLPPKEETIIEVALTPLQKQFYRAIYEKNTHFLFKGAKANNQPSLMNVMMELRKCCNHPYLIKGVEERIVSEMPLNQRNDECLHNKMVECAGKLVLLDKLLPRLYSEGHKVLIFSQMVKVLNLLEDYLRHKGYLYERLDGSTRSSDRHSAVERFCRSSLKRFIMLLSTKAGGLGLNLTSADTVIIFDSDWNPHNDIQAQARAHRIGQTKAVMVYRLLTRKTYEMHMFHKASLKLGLDRAVLAHARNEQEIDDDGDNFGNNNNGKNGNKIGLQVKEIDELLKRGAYDVFREDDTEQNDFVEADIDSIMQRRSHKVTYEGMTQNSISSTLGGFSKASFVSADEKEDVDINDPDFWKKAIGFNEPLPINDDPFVRDLPQQRKRKQTQVFGEDPITTQQDIDDLLHEDNHDNNNNGSNGNNGNNEINQQPPIKKEKKVTEPKLPKEPKDNKIWGPHSRDRVLRALLQFGFGRWDRIQRESGSMTRDKKDVESFIRAYMLQCGLCAGEILNVKGDTQFIIDAINAAKTIHELIQKGEAIGIEIPLILQEEKFMTKLKGSARKILHKLELLSKLNEMVESTLERVYTKKPEFERMLSIEEAVSVIPPAEIATELPLGNVRPSWTRPRNWWDEECDRHLVLGVFIHGYGKYHEIRDDNRFIFQTKMRDWALNTRALLRAHNGNNGSHNNNNNGGNGNGNNLYDNDNFNNIQLNGKDIQYSDDVAISHFTTPSGQECRVLISNSRQSEFKGVYSQPGSVKWMAQFGDNVSNVYLGTFDTELLAARAYDDYAREVEGDKAQCNFDKRDGGNRIKYDIDRTKKPTLPWHRASKYRGVRASGAKWTAQISYDGGNHHLGTFCSEIEAAVAYDTAALDHHGSNAISNFPFGVEKELLKFTDEVGVHVEFLGSGISTTSRINEAILKSRPNNNNNNSGSGNNNNNDKENDKDNSINSTTLTTQDNNDLNNNNNSNNNNNTTNNNNLKKKKLRSNDGGDVDDDIDSIDGDNDDMDLDENPSSSTNTITNGNNGSGNNNINGINETDKLDLDVGMPDARVLNRLFTWLVTSEAARMSKDELERKTKANKKARLQDIAGKREEKAKQAAEEDKLLNIRLGEKGILSLNYALFDSDAQHFSQKRSLLKKCEVNIKGKIRLDNGNNSNNNNNNNNNTINNNVNNDNIDNNNNNTNIEQSSQQDNVNENELSEEDVKRLCSALLLFGAPFDDNRLPLDSSILLSSIGISPLIVKEFENNNDNNFNENNDNNNNDNIELSDEPDLSNFSESEDMKLLADEVLRLSSFEDIPQIPEPSKNKLKIFTWNDLLNYAGVNLTSKQVKLFYTHTWLPFCVAISKTQSFANRVILPNPFLPPSSHSVSSKGLCSIFMQRQRNFRTVRYILSRHLKSLILYLKTNASKYSSLAMPVWWCPWIHDVAIMIGYIKHGYMALDAICKDSTLPFTTNAIFSHICRVFLYGSSNTLPVARGIFETISDALSWAKHSSLLFPDQFILENRLIKILSDLTKHLPLRHMCRITFYDDLDEIFTSSDLKKLHSNHSITGTTTITTRDGTIVLNTLDLHPVIPLSTFLNETKLRRRYEIINDHPLVFQSQES